MNKLINSIYNMSFSLKKELLNEELNMININMKNISNEAKINENKLKIASISDELRNIKNAMYNIDELIESEVNTKKRKLDVKVDEDIIIVNKKKK
jgi:hypothetical protein